MRLWSHLNGTHHEAVDPTRLVLPTEGRGGFLHHFKRICLPLFGTKYQVSRPIPRGFWPRTLLFARQLFPTRTKSGPCAYPPCLIFTPKPVQITNFWGSAKPFWSFFGVMFRGLCKMFVMDCNGFHLAWCLLDVGCLPLLLARCLKRHLSRKLETRKSSYERS